jgi:hypothetical protein
VVEEIAQYDDEPGQRVFQALLRRLHGRHSYARPVLGLAREVRSHSAARLRRLPSPQLRRQPRHPGGRRRGRGGQGRGRGPARARIPARRALPARRAAARGPAGRTAGAPAPRRRAGGAPDDRLASASGRRPGGPGDRHRVGGARPRRGLAPGPRDPAPRSAGVGGELQLRVDAPPRHLHHPRPHHRAAGRGRGGGAVRPGRPPVRPADRRRGAGPRPRDPRERPDLPPGDRPGAGPRARLLRHRVRRSRPRAAYYAALAQLTPEAVRAACARLLAPRLASVSAELPEQQTSAAALRGSSGRSSARRPRATPARVRRRSSAPTASASSASSSNGLRVRASSTPACRWPPAGWSGPADSARAGRARRRRGHHRGPAHPRRRKPRRRRDQPQRRRARRLARRLRRPQQRRPALGVAGPRRGRAPRTSRSSAPARRASPGTSSPRSAASPCKSSPPRPTTPPSWRSGPCSHAVLRRAPLQPPAARHPSGLRALTGPRLRALWTRDYPLQDARSSRSSATSTSRPRWRTIKPGLWHRSQGTGPQGQLQNHRAARPAGPRERTIYKDREQAHVALGFPGLRLGDRRGAGARRALHGARRPERALFVALREPRASSTRSPSAASRAATPAT